MAILTKIKIYQLLIITILCVIFSQAAHAISATSFSPTDGSTGVDGATNFQIGFDMNACNNTMGNFAIKRSDNNFTVINVPYSSPELTGNNTAFRTINPYITLTKNTDYYINISYSMFMKCGGMPPEFYSGITDTSTWNFSVGSEGACNDSFDQPCLSPADNSTGVNPSTDLVLTFHRAVEPYSPSLFARLRKFSDNSVVESFDLYSGTNVTFSGSTVTLNPTNSLEGNTHYYLTMNGGAIVATTDITEAYVGLITNGSWDFTTGVQWMCIESCNIDSEVKDPVFTPLDNATGVSLTSDLTMVFNATELSIDNTGASVHIKKTSDDSTVETISINNSSKITIETGNYMGDASTDTRIIINPAATLDGSTGYYVEIACDALKDSNNDRFGLNDKTIWNFTTVAGGDTTPPSVSTLSPADNATGVSPTANLVITFDEAVDLQSGNFVIKRSSNDATIETISVGSGQVTGNGTTAITVDPSVTLLDGLAYYVQIDASAIDDLAGNSYAGISNTTTWNFTISGTADTTAPTVLYYSPAVSAVLIARNQGLNLIFDETVVKGSGTIYVKRYSDDVTMYSVDVNSSDVVVSGSSMTIKAPSLLNAGPQFYVTVPSGGVEDLYANDFAGISSKDTWKFNTTQDHSLYSSY